MHVGGTDEALDRSGYPRSMSGGIPRGSSLYDNPLFDPSSSNRRASGGVASTAPQAETGANEPSSTSTAADQGNGNDDDDIMLA